MTTASGVGLEWRLSSETAWAAGTIRHLLWVGRVRNRLRSCRNDVELAAGEIRSHADRREWEQATETYQQTRARLDEICNLVFATEPVDQADLAPELTGIERELEEAHARLSIERARSQLDLGRQLVENGDYVQGWRVLGQAQKQYDRATQRADAVERGDAFQFGTQRELTEDLQRLGWRIQTVAAEPVKQAREAAIRAETAEETAEKIDHWETAFTRYGNVLTLGWGTDERHFAGDPAEIRHELHQSASRLVDLHCAAGNERWNDGASRYAADERKPALRACLDAREHLLRAHELAAEFESDRAETIASRLETMTDTVMRIRNAATEADDPSPDRSEQEADPGDERPEAKRELPSASELAGMDTHHEITLDVDGITVPAEQTVTEVDEQERKQADEQERKQSDEQERKQADEQETTH